MCWFTLFGKPFVKITERDSLAYKLIPFYCPTNWNLAVNYLSFSKEERIADPITTIARIGPS